MKSYVLDFAKVDKGSIAIVGGKGANLGELTRAGFNVPQGFCITTDAYKLFVSQNKKYDKLIEQLELINFLDLENLKKVSEQIRNHIIGLTFPKELENLVMEELNIIGKDKSYAIRSSATSEDLPDASFAGQQDTYLNISGKREIIKNIKKCFASLFTDRAILYRKKNNFSNKSVYLSVIVQEMVFSEVSGIMFTADPVSGNRNHISINASFGLGEALVGGLVKSDLYLVSDGNILKKDVSQKKVQIISNIEGGTFQDEISPDKQFIQSLSDKQIFKLSQLGKKIEKLYNLEQDIEWCLKDDTFYIVQSRPITSLFPLPENISKGLHFYISLGHIQMMTEAFKPMGMSVFLSFSKFIEKYFNSASPFLNDAGNHLYLDLINLLEYKILKKNLPFILDNVEQTSSRILVYFMESEEFKSIKSKDISFKRKMIILKFLLGELKLLIFGRFKNIYRKLDININNKLKKINNDLQKANSFNKISKIKSILNSIPSNVSETKLLNYMPLAIGSYKLLQILSIKWLGDNDEIDDIGKAPDGNVTTEMGLVIGDLADKINANVDVRYYFENSVNENFRQDLKNVNGGEDFLNSFNKFIEKYGNRCTGEIDITRPRWKDEPLKVALLTLNNVKNQEVGKHRNDFLLSKKEAIKASEKLIKRIKKTKYGFLKAIIIYRLIYVYRSIIGVREHPKFFLVNIFGMIRDSLLEEAELLVKEKVFKKVEYIYYFSFDEINKIIKTKEVDKKLLKQRKSTFERNSRLKAPRVFTGDGEILYSKSNSRILEGSISGTAASFGIVEGRARVILNLEDANLQKGDVIVTRYTDPAWTSLFSIAGAIVTEVGGLLTHGAVVAREFGIPAIVGVDDATIKIKDGDIIRVNGTQGYIEILKNAI